MDQSSQEKSEEERLKEYEDFLQTSHAGRMLDGKVESDLDMMATADSEDTKQFNKFKSRISADSEQVLIDQYIDLFSRIYLLYL